MTEPTEPDLTAEGREVGDADPVLEADHVPEADPVRTAEPVAVNVDDADPVGVPDDHSTAPPRQFGRGRFLRHVYTFRASEQAVHPATRLMGFTDAILAIAATLLVLQLSVSTDRPGRGLAHQIYEQRASLVSVLLGFIWIAGAWVLSHRSLRQLRGVDHYMTLLVIASTLSITLIPFATLLLAHGYSHGDFWVGVETVCLVVLIGTVLSAVGTDYAHRHGLLAVAAGSEQRRAALTIWYVVTFLVVLAVLVAPWVPWLAFTIVVFTRLSALLPLYSDRVGASGDLANESRPAHERD